MPGDGSCVTVSVLTRVFTRRNRCRLGRTRAAAPGMVSAHRALRTPTVNLLGLAAASRVWGAWGRRVCALEGRSGLSLPWGLGGSLPLPGPAGQRWWGKAIRLPHPLK